jgi:hypothetical protein
MSEADKPKNDVMPHEEQAAKAQLRQLLKNAAQWVYDKAPRGLNENPICPWCYYEVGYAQEDGQRQTTFVDHLEVSHPTALKAAYEQQDLDAYSKQREIEKEREELEAEIVEGLKIVEELDETDFLYVPKEYKDKAQREGGSHRWVTKQRFQRYRDAGFQVEERKESTDMPFQHNHEDTTMRTQEMVLMYVPEEIKTNRERRRQRLVKQQMPDDSTVDIAAVKDLGRRAYEHYRQNGMDHSNAMRMSDKVEKGQAVTEPSRERGEVSQQHRR